MTAPGTDFDDPRLTLGHFSIDCARRHGDSKAVVDDERSVTYAQLDAEVQALARGLVAAGVAKGARVAVWMPNSADWIAAAFAVSSVGAVLVPVNTFAPPAERDYILRHGDASLLILQPALGRQAFLEGLLADHPELERGRPGDLYAPGLPQLRRVVSTGLEAPRGGVETLADLIAMGEKIDPTRLEARRDAVHPSDDGFVIYTSGTTSTPKGVLHAQRTPVVQAHRFAEMLRFTPEDRVFSNYPFFWTAGIAMSIGGCFAAGARLLTQQKFEAGAALELMERERATAIHCWPHQQKALGEHPSARERDLSTLRKVEVSSPLAALAGVTEDLYDYGASYGLSETFTICSAIPADSPADERRGSSGKAWPGMRLRIVDPASGAVLGPDEPGEIAVKGVTLMKGYYKVAPERVFDADGYFHTQDGGSIDAEGTLHWTGRLSNLIKTGGANVSPVEIQEVLAGHPELKLGIPVGLEHPTLGQAIVLCCVPVAGATPDEDAIRRFLRERLAAYKVPKRVLFFRADELSYTSNNKVQTTPLTEAALKRLREERAEIEGHVYAPEGG